MRRERRESGGRLPGQVQVDGTTVDQQHLTAGGRLGGTDRHEQVRRVRDAGPGVARRQRPAGETGEGRHARSAVLDHRDAVRAAVAVRHDARSERVRQPGQPAATRHIIDEGEPDAGQVGEHLSRCRPVRGRCQDEQGTNLLCLSCPSAPECGPRGPLTVCQHRA